MEQLNIVNIEFVDQASAATAVVKSTGIQNSLTMALESWFISSLWSTWCGCLSFFLYWLSRNSYYII